MHGHQIVIIDFWLGKTPGKFSSVRGKAPDLLLWIILRDVDIDIDIVLIQGHNQNVTWPERNQKVFYKARLFKEFKFYKINHLQNIAGSS